jgi:hypothetical protein
MNIFLKLIFNSFIKIYFHLNMSKSQKGNSPNSHRKKEETSKRLLNRKTKRDANNQSLEQTGFKIYMPNEIRCSICLEYEKFSSECYKCIKCSSYFHIDCYNLFTFTEDNLDEIKSNILNNFKCIRCKDEEEEKNNINIKINCYLCMEHDGIIKKLIDNNYVHHYCYVYFKKYLNNVIKTGICKLCKKRNIYTIGCEAEKCNFRCQRREINGRCTHWKSRRLNVPRRFFR